jgi:outer membrane receptor protein involved in Fe transport
VPEWVINARLDYTFPGDRFSLFGEYRFNGTEVIQGSQSSGEVSNTILSKRDSYSIVDLGAKYKFDNGIKLSMGVNDVFNQGYKVLITTRYYDDGVSNLYPLPGRVYYATIGYSF